MEMRSGQKPLWDGAGIFRQEGTDVAIGRPDNIICTEGLAGIILFMSGAKLAYGKYGGLCKRSRVEIVFYTRIVLSGKRKTQSSLRDCLRGGFRSVRYQRLYGMTGNSSICICGKHAEMSGSWHTGTRHMISCMKCRGGDCALWSV